MTEAAVPVGGVAPSLQVRGILRDTWRLYRRLFARTTLTALAVFGALYLLEAIVPATRSSSSRLILALLFLVLPIVGTALIQGALVQVVDDERNGRAPQSLSSLYGGAWERFWPLLGVSILTGVLVGVGFLLLVVPGVFLFTRWSLAVPVVVLEGLSPRDAMRRSWQLVRGHSWAVFGVLLNVVLRTGIAAVALRFAFVALLGAGHSTLAGWLGATLASGLSTPYAAHAMSVVYYRIAHPERSSPFAPEPADRPWSSIWDEPRA